MMPASRPSKPKDGAVLSAPDVYNPEEWVTRTVPIIPRSEQHVALRDPETGYPLIDPKTGKIRTRLVKFGDDELDDIINKANQKMATKNFALVHIQHTDPIKVNGKKREKEVVGFLRNHRKGILYDEQGKVIDDTPHWLADMVIRKKHANEAFKFPHRSPEIDAHTMTLDSLALIDDPPKYHMGLVMNARDEDIQGFDHDPSVDLPKPSENEEESDMAGEAGLEDAPLTMKGFMEAMTPLIELAHIVREHISGEHEEPGVDGDDDGIADEDEGDGEIRNEGETTPGATNVAIPTNARRREREDEVERDDEELRNCDSDMNMQNSRDIIAVAKEVKLLRDENKGLKSKLLRATKIIEKHENEFGELQIQNARRMVDETIEELQNDYEIPNPKRIEERLLNAAAIGDDEFETEKEFTLELLQNSRKPLRVAAIPTRRGGDAPASNGAPNAKQTAAIRALSLQKGMSYTDARAQVMGSAV